MSSLAEKASVCSSKSMHQYGCACSWVQPDCVWIWEGLASLVVDVAELCVKGRVGGVEGT